MWRFIYNQSVSNIDEQTVYRMSKNSEPISGGGYYVTYVIYLLQGNLERKPLFRGNKDEAESTLLAIADLLNAEWVTNKPKENE
jgi:hypothetical protein